MSTPLVGPPDVTNFAPDTSVSAPSLDISSLPTSAPSTPMPVQAGSTDDLENQSLASMTSPDQSATQQTNAPQPAKPSLWRSVLSGALEGLAAGSQVNTRGMSGGSAFAAGAGAGANQVLNKVPEQNAALDKAKAEAALAHANQVHIQSTVAAMDEAQRNKYVDQAADHSQAGFESGAYVPVTQPFDNFIDAQAAYHAETLKNPWEVGAVIPVRGPNGGIQYSVVKSTRAPLQSDWTITGGSADGSDLTLPEGMPADAAIKVYLANQSKKLETQSKESLQNDKIAGQQALQQTKGAQAQTIQGMKGAQAAAKAAITATGTNVVAFDPDYQNADGSKGANVVLDKATAQQRGLFNYKADPPNDQCQHWGHE